MALMTGWKQRHRYYLSWFQSGIIDDALYFVHTDDRGFTIQLFYIGQDSLDTSVKFGWILA